MAGHSQFKNIMYRKGAQDAKRAKMFAKLAKEVAVAAREGADPSMNARLRTAIVAARAQNMPKDNIERAIKKGSGDAGGDAFEEIRYEGYGPGGVAMIVEALTDNRNRAASEVRSAFSKNGGSLGETNSVAFMFDRVGQIIYAADVADAEVVFDAALEAGAEDVISSDDSHEIICATEDFNTVGEALIEQFGQPQAAELTWKPQNTVPVDNDKAATLFKLIDVLEDCDDVQRVVANFDVSEDFVASLNT